MLSNMFQYVSIYIYKHVYIYIHISNLLRLSNVSRYHPHNIPHIGPLFNQASTQSLSPFSSPRKPPNVACNSTAPPPPFAIVTPLLKLGLPSSPKN